MIIVKASIISRGPQKERGLGLKVSELVSIAPVLDEKSKSSGRVMDDDEIGTSLSGDCGVRKGGSGKPGVR